MYRVVGVLAAERGISFEDERALAKLCDGLDLRFEERPGGLRTLGHGRDLSEAIRTSQAGQLASKVSTVPVVRERLVAKQREMGRAGGVVMEGRDIGTVVFPEAPVKVFLYASPEERARRRCADLRAAGTHVDEQAVAREIAERDERDRNRPHSPLRPADDAVLIDTTGQTIDEVVARLSELVERVVRLKL
jgi:cytidylate kinase